MSNPADRKILGEGHYVRLIDDDSWEYVERKRGHGVVSIVALTAENKILLVEQPRASMSGLVLELPAGLVGDESADAEDYAEAARRELLEETGYEAAEMVWLTRGPSSTGLTNEVIEFYLAQGLTRRHAGGGVGDERITVHEIPLAEIDQYLSCRVKNGQTTDPRIYIGLYFVRGSTRSSPA